MIKNTKDVENHRVVGMIVGPSGVGKTSLARTLKGRTLIGSAESGLLSLKGADIDFHLSWFAILIKLNIRYHLIERKHVPCLNQDVIPVERHAFRGYLAMLKRSLFNFLAFSSDVESFSLLFFRQLALRAKFQLFIFLHFFIYLS